MEKLNDFIKANYLAMTDKEIADKFGITVDSVTGRRKRMKLTKPNPTNETDRISKIAELLQKSGISPEEIGKVEKVRVGTYQMVTKNKEGEPEVHDLDVASLVLSPKWEDGPEWPVVQPASPVILPPIKIISKPKSDLLSCVVFPDPQIGYRFYMDTLELDPFHDERAINVGLQIAADLQPEAIVNLGDFLDLPAHSRFDQEPAFQQTTQQALQYGYELLVKQRSITNGDIILIEGNHDRRIIKSIMNNAVASYGLKQAGPVPNNWPVLSVPFLLNLESLNIKYIDGYPAGQYYLCDRLKFKHGEKTGKRGTIAAAAVALEKVSVIHGHNHHIEQVYASTDTNRGQRTNFAATIGCLCRTDGAVPSTKGSTNSNGRPILRHEDWQQAIGVVTYSNKDDNIIPSLEIVHIKDGFAIFRGKPYYAEDKK